ncbi:MAG: hypothetical protein CMK09_16330 [Ponticaulis sp.]|nr:hypothetical protein [Ponticaulis sp.]|tara:strand:- start:46281 stop:46745 length:465 start_codon:yes stop_codon:yes gene_type:complete
MTLKKLLPGVLGLSCLAVACTATETPPPPPPLAPPPVEADTSVSCLDDSYLVYFPSGQTDLDDEAIAIIEAIVEQAKACEPSAIEVVGYADAVGSEDVNIRVSQQRADAVLEALLAENLSVPRIAIAAAGEKDAMTEDDLIVPMARRVEVRLVR